MRTEDSMGRMRSYLEQIPYAPDPRDVGMRGPVDVAFKAGQHALAQVLLKMLAEMEHAASTEEVLGHLEAQLEQRVSIDLSIPAPSSPQVHSA